MNTSQIFEKRIPKLRVDQRRERSGMDGRSNGWRSRTESTERRNSEEDVGDLLLGVGEVLWEFSHSKKENGKGKEDEVHHVPAPSLAFYLERKPIPCLGTPLDATATPAPFHATQGDEEVKVGSRERKSSMQMEQQQQRSKMDVSGKKEQRQETELDESWLKITMAGKVTPNTGLGCKGVALSCCLKC